MEHVTSKVPAKVVREERSLVEALLHYYHLLLQYKWLIIIVTGAAAVLVVVFSVVSILLPPDQSPLPNKYTASALLLVQQGKGSSVSGMLASLGFANLSGGETNYGQMAVTVLGTKSIVDKLVEEFGIADKEGESGRVRTSSRKYFTDRFETFYDKTAATLTVGFTHIDPTFARDVVNRSVELLDDWFTIKSGTTTLRQKELLERKLAEMEGEIAKLEENIATFQKTHGALRAEDLGAAQIQMLTDLQTQLMEKELAIKNYQSYSNIEDPALRKLKIERDNIVDLISRIQQGYIGSGRKGPSQDELPDLALELAHLTLGLEIQRTIYQTLSQQYEVTKLSVESEPVFQIMEMAEVPDEKSEPSRGRICMIVTVLAFLGSIGVAFAHNSLVRAKKPAPAAK